MYRLNALIKKIVLTSSKRCVNIIYDILILFGSSMFLILDSLTLKHINLGIDVMRLSTNVDSSNRN